MIKFYNALFYIFFIWTACNVVTVSLYAKPADTSEDIVIYDGVPNQPNHELKQIIETWEINSARTVPGIPLDKQYMLSPSSYFKFINFTQIEFKLNEFYPVQSGTCEISDMAIHIRLNKDPNCTACFEDLTISRKSAQDTEYLLEFGDHQQLFSIINKISKTQ
jgi:hypothetical protein